ncbi:GAF domain-containing protein [Streptomyces hoynatensis]|uniref:GAF domain-containing protein n=1 Tax=Streptomyces hoynatensis TaxID=1141874 RepID=A0A3A9Z9G1_9ACTN|nr:GAF domain-containing protein [Streptomyces hoynatensis]RKN43946.1 GAF domain-containing protein [Streptomyces hoynatensis]
MNLSTHDEILRSTVRLARLSFAAAAASVCLYDHERQALVFEASSGPGEDRLLGVAIPSDSGIAGWVANTGEPLVVRGVATDERFNREFAAGTGLVPDTILAAPIEHQGDVLGVLEVLDPRLEGVGEISAIDLLTELANQSCAALALLLADRRARARRAAPRGAVSQLAALLDQLGPEKEAAAQDLVNAMVKLLA